MLKRLTLEGKEQLRKEMGSRLRYIRNLYGFSREKLAEELDVSLAQISQIERGERGINAESLIGICSVFQCSSDYLLMGKENFTNETSGSKIGFSIDSLNDHSKQKIADFIDFAKSLQLKQ